MLRYVPTPEPPLRELMDRLAGRLGWGPLTLYFHPTSGRNGHESYIYYWLSPRVNSFEFEIHPIGFSNQHLRLAELSSAIRGSLDFDVRVNSLRHRVASAVVMFRVSSVAGMDRFAERVAPLLSAKRFRSRVAVRRLKAEHPEWLIPARVFRDPNPDDLWLPPHFRHRGGRLSKVRVGAEKRSA